MVKVATEKCWLIQDGRKLVKEGDVNAARLFAIKGTALDESALVGIDNVDEFFEPLNAPKKAEPPQKEAAHKNPPHKEPAHKTAAHNPVHKTHKR